MILIILTFLILFWVITYHLEDKRFLRTIMLSSFLYGSFVVIIVRSIFGDILEHPAYFPDAYNYLECATIKAAEWRGEGKLGYIPLSTRGYVYFIAVIYSIFGQNLYAVILIQLILALLIPIFTFLIALEFFDTKTAKISALFITFFPDLYAWASFALKEIIAVFSICLAVLGFLKFRKDPNWVKFLATVGSLIILLFVRPHIALFLALVFMFASIRPVTIKKLLWLPTGAAVLAIFISQAGLSGFLTMVSETPLPVYNRGEILVTGTLPELFRMIISGQLLSTFLLGIGRYLISPLPWQATNAYQAVIPGIILWYFVISMAIWGVIGAIRGRKPVYILMFIILFLVLWYGLIVTGTDPRWRLMIVPFMCIFGAYGFQLLKKSLSGVVIWISGVLVIWLFLSFYASGREFVLWVLVPTLVIGALVGLAVFRKRAGEVIR